MTIQYGRQGHFGEVVPQTVKALGYRFEGWGLKPQHHQADTVERLTRPLKQSAPGAMYPVVMGYS